MGPAAPSGPPAINHNNMPDGFSSHHNVDSMLTNGRGMSGQTMKSGPPPQRPFPPLEELVMRGEPKVDINTPVGMIYSVFRSCWDSRYHRRWID